MVSTVSRPAKRPKHCRLSGVSLLDYQAGFRHCNIEQEADVMKSRILPASLVTITSLVMILPMAKGVPSEGATPS